MCVTITLIAGCSTSAVGLFNFSGQTVQLERSRCSVFRGILRFTALLKTALRNRKIDYITEQGKRYGKEFPLVDYVGLAGDEYDFIQAIIDYDVLKTALKSLSDREKKIIVAHILEDKDFAEIGRCLGLTYKGTATAFYRAITKLRETLGRYRDEF